MVELLYQENVMALVGGGKNPKWPKTKVIMWDDQEVKSIEELIFNAEIEVVRMRRECVIVLQKRSVYIYSFPEFQIIGQIETFESQFPVVGLSMSDTNFVLAIPSRQEGNIMIKKSLDGNMNPETLVAHAERRV